MSSSRRRRKRFVANLADAKGYPVQRMFMGYTAQEARAFYESRGYKVRSIAPLQRGTLTHNPPANPGYRLDQAAIERAKRELGLTLPVTIKKTGHKGGRRGVYIPAAPSRHEIRIKDWMDAERASKTLHHELRHAYQAENLLRRAEERYGRALTFGSPEFISMWKATDRGVSYQDKSKEIDARRAESNHDHNPLTMPLRSTSLMR